jgi:hypothetical protein
VTVSEHAVATDDLTTPARQREMEWISQNPQAIARYAGEWVALVGEQIVAHGADLGHVMEEAYQAGHPEPLVFEAWSEDEGEWLF